MIIKLGSVKVQKVEFYSFKTAISMDDIDTRKIFVISGERDSKLFVSYQNTKTIKPICTLFPPMISYLRKVDGAEIMNALIND